MTIKVHPTAEVQSNNIGEGTTIWQHCVILKNAIIGKNCNINFNVFIENDVEIGDNVTIKSGVQIWNGLRIGNNVFIGPNATFTNDLLPRSKQYPESFYKTIVEEGASIGANATVIAGITIGKFSMIGAGSVITKNVPPFTLWYGNPAILKGYVTRIGKVISLDLSDKVGNKYILDNNEPILI
jgi:UDP-2-acetamido-3-amino-2,3-dideoxy-glucuronate N-acetyltransferase